MSVTPTVLPADPETLPTEVPKPTPSTSTSKTVLVTPWLYTCSLALVQGSPGSLSHTLGPSSLRKFPLYSPNGLRISTYSIFSLLMLSVYVSVRHINK